MHVLLRCPLMLIALATASCAGAGSDGANAPVSTSLTNAAAPPPAPAAPPGDTKPFAFESSATRADAETRAPTCALANFSMPANARIYAAGAYSGQPTTFQIDDSGHAATTIDVGVNEPAAPVVLILGAYEPTVWSVGWARGTRIAGVLVTGYHRQRITGLPAGVPVLVSTYDNRGPCGYAYVGGEGTAKLNALSRSAFGRAVDTAFVAREGRVQVGHVASAYITDAAARAPDAFRRQGVPPAGKAGLDAAVAAGVLRPATQADAEDWARVQRAQSREDVPPVVGAPEQRATVPYNGYVVLKPFEIPAGLYGAHSATFIVARGVPLPTGNPGHSDVLDLNTGRCIGVACRAR